MHFSCYSLLWIFSARPHFLPHSSLLAPGPGSHIITGLGKQTNKQALVMASRRLIMPGLSLSKQLSKSIFFYRTCASAISYKRCRNKNVFACLCTRILAISICQTLWVMYYVMPYWKVKGVKQMSVTHKDKQKYFPNVQHSSCSI